MSVRLNDQILTALHTAIEQGDEAIARHLKTALELGLTRLTGGPGFVERRDVPQDVERAFKAFAELEQDPSRRFG
ncbi:MAG: hypothetical protein Alpg2KO_15460 [Alphaproteobacteria bacterium]